MIHACEMMTARESEGRKWAESRAPVPSIFMNAAASAESEEKEVF